MRQIEGESRMENGKRREVRLRGEDVTTKTILYYRRLLKIFLVSETGEV